MKTYILVLTLLVAIISPLSADNYNYSASANKYTQFKNDVAAKVLEEKRALVEQNRVANDILREYASLKLNSK
jgi:hypothetical protein